MYIVLKHFSIYYCYITFQCNNLDLCKTTHFGVQTEAAQVSDNLLAGLITVIQTTLTCHMYFFKDILYNCTFSQVSLIFTE